MNVFLAFMACLSAFPVRFAVSSVDFLGIVVLNMTLEGGISTGHETLEL